MSSTNSSLGRTSSGSCRWVAVWVQAETGGVSQGIDLSLSHNRPRLTRADETDHLEHAGIVPHVADTCNAVLDKRSADDLCN